MESFLTQTLFLLLPFLLVIGLLSVKPIYSWLTIHTVLSNLKKLKKKKKPTSTPITEAPFRLSTAMQISMAEEQVRRQRARQFENQVEFQKMKNAQLEEIYKRMIMPIQDPLADLRERVLNFHLV